MRPTIIELNIELEETIGQAMLHSLPDEERRLYEEEAKKRFGPHADESSFREAG